MTLTQNHLDKITILAETAFPPWTIAFMLDIEPEEFKLLIEDITHPASVAYYKGFYSNEHAVIESVMQLARDGSSPAQNLALQLIEKTKTHMRLYDYKSIDSGKQ